MTTQSLRAICCIMALAIWWGGLTFYALVVVPIGTDLFGSVQQGLVTQQVTNWLNGIGLGTLALLLWNVVVTRSRLLAATWLAMALSLGAVSLLHLRLDALLGGDAGTPSVEPDFYDVHRVYLLITAVQWLAGAVHFGGLATLRAPVGKNDPA